MKRLAVLIVFITLSFLITNQWFGPECPFTSLIDVEGHFMNSLIFQNQLLEYGTTHPVSFEYHALGYYIFSYSPVSYLFPLIFRIFFNPRLAFLITYNLVYALSGFTFFLFLRKNKGSFAGSFLFSLLFLLSGIMTLQFAITGSYHSIAALPFFFTSLICLQDYESKKKPNDAFMFVILAVIAMSIHFFVGVILFTLFVTYLLYKKEYKLLAYFFTGTLITSFYYLPLIDYSFSLSNGGNLFELNPDNLWMVSSFQLLTASSGPGSTNHYYYNGPYYLIAAIISIAYLHKKRELGKAGLIINYIIVMITLLLLWSSVPMFGSIASYDRVSFFLQLSLIMITAYTFSRYKFKIEVPLIALGSYLIALIMINQEDYQLVSLFQRMIFTHYQLIITIILFGYYFYSIRKKLVISASLKNKLFLIVVEIIFLQYTLILSNPQVASHATCTIIDTSKLNDMNIVMIDKSVPELISLPYYVNTRIVNPFGHTTLLKELPYLNDNEFYNFTVKGRIDTYLTLGEFSDEQIILTHRENNYSLSIIRGGVDNSYNLTQTGPLSFNVSLPQGYNTMIIRIFYNPLWHAYEGDRELYVEHYERFTLITGIENGELTLVFDDTIFMIARMISFTAMLLLGLAYYSTRKTKTKS